MNSKEALARLYNDAISMNEIEEDVENIKKDYELVKQDLDRLEQLEEENQELRKRETPMKPVRKGKLNSLYCPKCDRPLMFEGTIYCDKCGQKLGSDNDD